MNISIEEFNKALEEAYEVPSKLLGRQRVQFISTTNPAFSDRVGLHGYITFSGSVIQFNSSETFRVGSMHTSYVVSITHQEQLVALDGEEHTRKHNEITVNTRNSTYGFLLTDPDTYDGLVEFTWELPEALKDTYEDLLSAYGL